MWLAYSRHLVIVNSLPISGFGSQNKTRHLNYPGCSCGKTMQSAIRVLGSKCRQERPVIIFSAKMCHLRYTKTQVAHKLSGQQRWSRASQWSHWNLYLCIVKKECLLCRALCPCMMNTDYTVLEMAFKNMFKTPFGCEWKGFISLESSKHNCRGREKKVLLWEKP